MSIVNFSKNSTHDILKKAKQIEAEQTRKNLKKTPIAKHLNQLENSGVLDAINDAPKREWGDLFTHMPSFKYINEGFVKSKGLSTEFDALKAVQCNKQWAKNIRNVSTGLAIGAGIAAAALNPLGHVAGLGYLAGWAMPTAITAGVAGLTSVTMQAVNAHNFTENGGFNIQEADAFNNFTNALKARVGNNITDMHKYWHAADKLAKVPMSESAALKALSSIYTEANNKLRETHNVSLVDVYLNSDEKTNLKNYTAVADASYTATSLSKDMTELPTSLDHAHFETKGTAFTDGASDNNDDLKKVIGFKLHALEDIGVTVDKAKLGLDDTHTIADINDAINKHYGVALDDALLVYQGKHSMAAPIIEKVEKILHNALEIFSEQVIKQAKARNLKNVPKITGEVVEKVLSAIMLQTSIPANDTKLTKILNAIANNTALKLSANLNNYASDTNKAEQNKVLYAAASLDNLYDNDVLRIKEVSKKLTAKDLSGLADLAETFSEQNLKNADAKILKQIATNLSKTTGEKVWVSKSYLGGKPTLKTRRYNGLWNIIPNVTSKAFDIQENTSELANAIHKAQ
jgi:hypothetical protein